MKKKFIKLSLLNLFVFYLFSINYEVYAYDLDKDIELISNNKKNRQVEINNYISENKTNLNENTKENENPSTNNNIPIIDNSKNNENNNENNNSIIDTNRKLLNDILEKQIGKPYKWGANGPEEFDCSGLVQYAFSQISINIPRTVEQMTSIGTEVDKENLKIGDILVFSNTTSVEPSHVGVYIGNNEFIHSPKTSKTVTKQSLDFYYNSHLIMARRLLN